MRSYPCGKRQSLPRLRHTCRSYGAISSAAAISVIVHAGINSFAQTQRLDVFLSAFVRAAADSIVATIAYGSATVAVLRRAAADSIIAAITCGSATVAVLRRAAADSVDTTVARHAAADSNADVKFNRNDTRNVYASSASFPNGCACAATAACIACYGTVSANHASACAAAS